LAPAMDNPFTQELAVEGLGHRGEGFARGPVYIPGALPGERVLARIDGERGRLIEVLNPSSDRIAPVCPHFGVCGGCAMQHVGPALYAAWKREIVVSALERAHIDAHVGPLIDAQGEGRRRATFHARFAPDSAKVEVGFVRARSHDIVEIDACPVLAPGMSDALDAARMLSARLRSVGKPLDFSVTATLSGLDVDIRGCGALDFPTQQKLIDAAHRLNLARVSNHGAIIIERRAPEVVMGAARVRLTPGGFLQATEAGEIRLAETALRAVQDAKRVADLFCGAGAFALRLAAHHDTHAVEVDRLSLAALGHAARATPGLRPIACEARDLFHRPLSSRELRSFDAILFDPPRAGAEEQSRQLASSSVPTVVAISCNATTFARDVGILVAGGYLVESVTPIDQFRFSPHVEIVAVLRRPPVRRRPKGPTKGMLG
jgi:23S rRNA (uracil1939-C5)-methyltransferase